MLSPNVLKFQIPYAQWGRGEVGPGSKFQLFVLSPNLLKSKIPYAQGEGVLGIKVSTFDTESKSANIQNSTCPGSGGGGGGGGVSRINVPTFDTESKSANIQNSTCPGSGGRGVSRINVPTFDTESKSTQIQNSLCSKLCWIFSSFRAKSMLFQGVLLKILYLSRSTQICPNAKFSYFTGGGGGTTFQLLFQIPNFIGRWSGVDLLSNFSSESKYVWTPNSHILYTG